MKLIIGLGNPGQEYEKTRHNTGWRAVDRLAGKIKWGKEKKLSALLAIAKIAGHKVLLAKPETFMNNSGAACSKLKNFYKIKKEDILIVYDDIDLPLGSLRLRAAGSAGGHQGLQSVLRALKSQSVSRVKIGIAESRPGRATPSGGVILPGKPGTQKIPSEDYVLKNFSKKGEEILEKAFTALPEVVAGWVKREINDTTIKVF